ncbi:MAG: MFS transporter [Demequinaceae bacterium]|nr:MFS transporter [Demequinaceae bacterium]
MPTIVAEIGVGAMYPVMALSAVRMGASATIAAAVVTMYVVGRLAGSAIGGGIAAGRGATRAAILSLVAMGIAAGACAVGTTIPTFTAAVVLFGIAHSVFHVARQSQVVHAVSRAVRARGLTTLAGMWRVGNFVGPVIGSVLIHAWGLRTAYALGFVCALAGAAWMCAAGYWGESRNHVKTESGSSLAVVREHKRLIGTLGVGLALTTAIRSARMVALPLWAEHLGIPEGTASAIWAASMAVDAALFYPAGYASDRWGRRWSAVPSTGVLALGFAFLPFTGDVAGLTVAALLMGIGNGWGSGLLMTLAADLAPRRSRSAFIGVWMMIADVGALAGPAIVSLGALASLSLGILGVAAVGAVSTGMLQAWIPPQHDPD